MRLGFAITGIGAACAFAVVSSRSTLALHGTSREFFASPTAQSPGVQLVTRDAEELIRLDQLQVLEDPLQPFAAPRLADFDTHAPPSGGGSWPLPVTSLWPGQGLGGDFPILAGSAAAAASDIEKTAPPPSPPDPPPPDPPQDTGGSSGALIASFVQQPPAPDAGGDPPVVPDPFSPPSNPPVVVPTTLAPPPPVSKFVTPSFLSSAAPPSATPEPSTWMVMLVGCAAMGAGLRRHRAQRMLRAAPVRSGSGGEG